MGDGGKVTGVSGANAGFRPDGARDDFIDGVGLSGDTVWTVLWRNRWVLAGGLAVCVAAGVVYLLAAERLYTGVSRLYVEPSGPRIIADVEGLMTGSKNYLYTQAELLRSTPVLAAALAMPGMADLACLADVDNRLAHVRKQLSVEVGKKDDLITVAFEAADPVEAAGLVNAVVEAYVTYHAEHTRSTAAEVLTILRKERSRVGEEFDRKSAALAAFKKAHAGLAFETRQGNVVLERLGRLSAAVTEAELAVIEARGNLEAARRPAADPNAVWGIDGVVDGGIAGSWAAERGRLQAEVDRQRARLVELGAALDADAPPMRTVRGQIAALEERLDGLERRAIRAHVAALERQYATALDQERQIRALFEQQREAAVALNEQTAQLQRLEAELEQTRRLSELLDRRIEELSITEDAGALNISVVEVARVEEEPSHPRAGRVMALALFAGMVCGVAASAVREATDQRVRTVEQVWAIPGVTVLGAIPRMMGADGVGGRCVAALREPHSAVVEACRMLRTAMVFGRPGGAAGTLLVTGPVGGEGKTTIAANLAIVLAQAGRRVLLVDGDLRRPRLGQVFGLSGASAGGSPALATSSRSEVSATLESPEGMDATNGAMHGGDGLTSLLAGLCGGAAAIRATEVAGLEVLAAGPAVPNPAEVLQSAAFERWLREAAGSYDHVIVDSPPVLRVTDAGVLAARCQATLLVVRAGRSTRKMVGRACEAISAVGGRLLGVVVNDVRETAGGYGYGYGYGYGPGAGRDGGCDSQDGGESRVPGRDGCGRQSGRRLEAVDGTRTDAGGVGAEQDDGVDVGRAAG